MLRKHRRSLAHHYVQNSSPPIYRDTNHLKSLRSILKIVIPAGNILAPHTLGKTFWSPANYLSIIHAKASIESVLQSFSRSSKHISSVPNLSPHFSAMFWCSSIAANAVSRFSASLKLSPDFWLMTSEILLFTICLLLFITDCIPFQATSKVSFSGVPPTVLVVRLITIFPFSRING